MKEQDNSVEERILEAARDVFLKKGYDGARMQEIADEAKINKAMLHYYFRSKDKLFDQIFNVAIRLMFPEIAEILNGEMSFEDKIKKTVRAYISFLQKHRYLPGFVIHELNSNPERLVQHFERLNIRKNLEAFQNEIDDEIKAGKIRPIKAEQLIVNIIAMVIFPFAARPIIMHVTAKNESEYDEFLEERKTLVAEFILNSLRL
jgi:AcrR family transcriptional regulator